MKVLQIINCLQKSDKWFELRAKRMTVSHAQAIGTCGKGLNTYITNKLAEYYSSAEKENYSNADIERGVELEDIAGSLYAWEHNHVIQKVGFVIYNDYVGCSPDLFVDKDGLGEIKCPNDTTYFNLLVNEKIDTKYEWQIQGQLLVCEKKWCDYIVYNPNFEQNLFVKRVYPDQKKFAKLKEGFEIGEKLIKEIEAKVAA